MDGWLERMTFLTLSWVGDIALTEAGAVGAGTVACVVAVVMMAGVGASLMG